MKSPAALNSRTGGAALGFSSADKVRGRCNTQTLPCASTFELDTMPRIHWLGTLGQVGSTLNLGTSRAVEDGACAAAVPTLRSFRTPATITAPNTTTIAAIVRFMGTPPGPRAVFKTM